MNSATPTIAALKDVQVSSDVILFVNTVFVVDQVEVAREGSSPEGVHSNTPKDIERRSHDNTRIPSASQTTNAESVFN